MNYMTILQKYCMDAPEPTKADIDAYFKNEQEFAKVNAAADSLRKNDKAKAKTLLENAKKLYMDFSKNSAKTKAMIDKKMLGPWIDDFNRVKRSRDFTYQFIVKCCNAAIAGKDPRDVGF